jgi:hypothetical protein
MNRKAILMKHTGTMALLFSSFLLPLLGCGNSVLGEGPSGPGGGGAGSTGTESTGTDSTGTGTLAPSVPTGLALRVGDLPGGLLPWNSGFAPYTAPPPAGTDPDTLLLLLGNGAASCAVPQTPVSCQPDVWQMLILIPPAVDRVGPIDLGDPRIFIAEYLSTSVAPCTAFVTQFPAGYGQATLDIVSSDASAISGNFDGNLVHTNVVGTDPTNGVIIGPYDFQRCGAPPPVAPPAPAVAMRGSSLPVAASSSLTVGSSPDPTDLYVFLGTAPETCASPVSSLACTGTGRLAFRLPSVLQVAGTIPLDHPALAASFDASIASAPGCDPSADEAQTLATRGQLQILSIDAATITFQIFEGVAEAASPADLSPFDADGLYTATICP